MATYRPNNTIVPQGINVTAWLSQRDLALRVPINYVTHATVALRPACFARNEYLFTGSTTCLSNLIAAKYARFIIDLYWDPDRTVWGLCPARLAASAAGTDAPQSSVTNNNAISSVQLSPRAETTGTITSFQIERRKTSGVTPLVSLLSSVTTSATATPLATPANAVRAGPYLCDSNLTFTVVNQVLANYFIDTSNNVDASLKYMILNLHLAVDYTGGDASAAQGLNLPSEQHGLSSVLNDTLASYLYTPMDLQTQRANINDSWYGQTADYKPLTGYFTTENTTVSALKTTNGWPGEGFVELDNRHRLLVGFGSVDPLLQGYNVSRDEETIFPANEIMNLQAISVTDNGVSHGCYFGTNIPPEVSAANNSFALSGNAFDSPVSARNLNSTINIASSLIHCGISPLLNTTLLDETADFNPTPFARFATSAIWSWASGQPVDSDDSQNDDDVTDRHRCAVLNTAFSSSTNLTRNNWQVEDCSASYYGLCRAASQPYSWRLSSQKGVYTYIDKACPDGTSFDVPRTALENAFALAAIQRTDAYTDSVSGDGPGLKVWLNFNDLDIPSCWVVGTNSNCPYTRPKGFKGRAVAVPTVSAVLVFALAVLTIFVKCAGNRKMSRRRRNGDAQWAYEGIPS